MIREVDLASYLPEFMQSYKEPVAALEAENPEFAIVWDAVNRIMYNHFISTADEYGISRFERLLGIYPTEEDTLESRRSRVQSKWFNKLPYTLKVFLQKLMILCEDSNFTLINNFSEGYTLNLTTDLKLYSQVEELEFIIKTMLPCNIAMDVKNDISQEVSGEIYVCGGIAFAQDVFIESEEIWKEME